MDSSGLFGGNEFHADFFGTLSQLPENALAVTLLVVVLALVSVFLALGQHRIDQAGELVGGGGDGFGFVHAGAHSSEVNAESRLAVSQSGSGQTQCLCRTIGTTLSLAAHHLATGDLGAWTQPDPTREVTVAKRDMSAPVPEITAKAVVTSMPSMRVCYMGHALMENRKGLVVGVETTQSTGKAEREAATVMVERSLKAGATVGADKNYDTAGFVKAMRQRKVTPHVAQKNGQCH